MHCTTLHYITLHCIAVHYLHYIAWRDITLHLHCNAWHIHDIALHYISNIEKPYITEQNILLQNIALHYLTLHYSTLHYFPLHYRHTCIHAYMRTCIHTDRPTDRQTDTHTHLHTFKGTTQNKTEQNITLPSVTLHCITLHDITWHNFNYITLPSFTSHHINYITLPCLTLHSNYITDTSQRKRLQDVSRYPQAKGNDYLYRNRQKPNSSHQIYVQSWMRLSNCLFNICGSTVSHRFWFVLFVGVAVNISSPERTGQYVHLLLDVMETLGT